MERIRSMTEEIAHSLDRAIVGDKLETSSQSHPIRRTHPCSRLTCCRSSPRRSRRPGRSSLQVYRQRRTDHATRRWTRRSFRSSSSPPSKPMMIPHNSHRLSRFSSTTRHATSRRSHHPSQPTRRPPSPHPRPTQVQFRRGSRQLRLLSRDCRVTHHSSITGKGRQRHTSTTSDPSSGQIKSKMTTAAITDHPPHSSAIDGKADDDEDGGDNLTVNIVTTANKQRRPAYLASELTPSLSKAQRHPLFSNFRLSKSDSSSVRSVSISRRHFPLPAQFDTVPAAPKGTNTPFHFTFVLHTVFPNFFVIYFVDTTEADACVWRVDMRSLWRDSRSDSSQRQTFIHPLNVVTACLQTLTFSCCILNG
ncbi:hypothetical protein BLNAU_14117 [Blattamonas nauphoetae]|uniref:Uncharacterized protein n=1 Tax=Blattamonas nauphoetae TaxID=2049346 RepID=A0ABQ9XHV6_9EUKA|nr:hypothetical protein BLNAU_14117 [Blattamonas nauphoetae]